MSDNKPMVFETKHAVYVCNGRKNLVGLDPNGRALEGLLVSFFYSAGASIRKLCRRESKDTWSTYDVDQSQIHINIYPEDALFKWLCECEERWPSSVPVFLLDSWKARLEDKHQHFFCINTRRIDTAGDSDVGLVVREARRLCAVNPPRPWDAGVVEAVYVPLPEGLWKRLVWDHKERSYQKEPPQKVDLRKLWVFLDKVWRDVTGETRLNLQKEELRDLLLKQSDLREKISELQKTLDEATRQTDCIAAQVRTLQNAISEDKGEPSPP
jgi:hypothetical protein